MGERSKMSKEVFEINGAMTAKLELAVRRNGGTRKLVDDLCKGNVLAQIFEVLEGRAEIKQIEHLINFDDKPSVPNGWTILPDNEQLAGRVRGLWKFDPTKLNLHLDNGQRNGKRIEGNELRKKLVSVPVFGAKLGDFLYKNPQFIPESWKGKAIFFWGTIYLDAVGNLSVRCLCHGGVSWDWRYGWLDCVWDGSNPAVVSGK